MLSYRSYNKTLYDNINSKSVLCDKFLRYKNCNRVNCQWDHRAPKPGEPLPVCPKLIASLGTYACDPDKCPLSHDVSKLPKPKSQQPNEQRQPSDEQRRKQNDDPKTTFASNTRTKRPETDRRDLPTARITGDGSPRNNRPQPAKSRDMTSVETTTRNGFEGAHRNARPVVRIPMSQPAGDQVSQSPLLRPRRPSYPAKAIHMYNGGWDSELQTTSMGDSLHLFGPQSDLPHDKRADLPTEGQSPTRHPLGSSANIASVPAPPASPKYVCVSKPKSTQTARPYSPQDQSSTTAKKRSVEAENQKKAIELGELMQQHMLGILKSAKPQGARVAAQSITDGPSTSKDGVVGPRLPDSEPDTVPGSPEQPLLRSPKAATTVLVHPSPRRNSSAKQFLTTNNTAPTTTEEKKECGPLKILTAQAEELKTPSPIRKRKEQRKNNTAEFAIERRFQDALRTAVPEQRESPFQNQFIEVNETVSELRKAVKASLGTDDEAVKSTKSSEPAIEHKIEQSPRPVPIIMTNQLSNLTSMEIKRPDTPFSDRSEILQYPSPSNAAFTPQAITRTYSSSPPSAHPNSKGSGMPISSDHNPRNMSAPDSVSGYRVAHPICYNCWSNRDIDNGWAHRLECCPEPFRDLFEREILRQQKRIWNKRWATIMCNSGNAEALYVPPEHLESLKDFVHPDVWMSLQKNSAADRIKILKRTQSPKIAPANTSPVELKPPSPSDTPLQTSQAEVSLISFDSTDVAFNATASTSKKDEGASSVAEARIEPDLLSGIDDNTTATTTVAPVQPDLLENIPPSTVSRKTKPTCWNCWETTDHEAYRCPKIQLRLLEREKIRQRKQIWCPRWARLMLKKGYLKSLKVTGENWKVMRAILEDEGEPVWYLKLNEEGYVVETDEPQLQMTFCESPVVPQTEEVEDLLLQTAIESSLQPDTPKLIGECWNCGQIHLGFSCEDAKHLKSVKVEKKSTEGSLIDLLDSEPNQEAPAQKTLREQCEAAFAEMDELDAAAFNEKKPTSDGLYQFTEDLWATETPKSPEEIRSESASPDGYPQGDFNLPSTFDDLADLDWGSTTHESAAPTDEPWTPDFSSVSGDGDHSPRRLSYEDDVEQFVLGPQPMSFPVERIPKGPRRQYKAKLRMPIRKSGSGGLNSRASLAALPGELITMIVEWFAEILQSDAGFTTDGASIEEESKIQTYLGSKLQPVVRLNRRFHDITQRFFYRNIRISSLSKFRKFLRTICERDCYLGDLVEDFKVDVPQAKKNERIRGFSDREPAPQSEREKRIRREMLEPKTLTMLPRLFMKCPNLKVAYFSFIGSIQSFDELPERDIRSNGLLRSLTLKDIDDNGYSAFSLWKHIQSFPNLQELYVNHSDHTRGEQRLKIPSSIQPYRDGWYRSLKSIYMQYAPEISSEWLVIFANRMPKLESVHIIDCKLVTTDGVVRLITSMSQPLKELTWVPYLDTQACPDPIEDEASSYHLCTALRKHSKSLISLRMKPIKICSCFFKDSEWPDLQELNIDLLEFKACNGKEKEHEVQESLESAVAPYLGAPVSRFTRLHHPHLTFNRSNAN